MTKEEAKNNYDYIIKALNKRRMAPCGFCTSDKCIPNPHECTKDDFVIDKAIEALEKQIPKRPIFEDLGKGVRCPTCYDLFSCCFISKDEGCIIFDYC